MMFCSEDLLSKHIQISHQNQAYSPTYRMPQFDGPLDLFDSPPDENIRTSNYTLNKEKQIEKIVKDASATDYDVNINSSDQNVTIKCSTGFYIQVAKPTFLTLDDSATLSVNEINISIINSSITKDIGGVEATKLIHFSFARLFGPMGGVTVHLHHSTRTIQIQGGTLMPNSTRSAVWFLDHVTLPRFKEMAKSKKFAIKNTNDAFLSSSNSLATKKNQPLQISAANLAIRFLTPSPNHPTVNIAVYTSTKQTVSKPI